MADDHVAANAVNRHAAVGRQAHGVEADDVGIQRQVKVADAVVAQRSGVHWPGAPDFAGLHRAHIGGAVPPFGFLLGRQGGVVEVVAKLQFKQAEFVVDLAAQMRAADGAVDVTHCGDAVAFGIGEVEHHACGLERGCLRAHEDAGGGPVLAHGPQAVEREGGGRGASVDNIVEHAGHAAGVVHLPGNVAGVGAHAVAHQHAVVILENVAHPGEAHAARHDVICRVGAQVNGDGRGRPRHAVRLRGGEGLGICHRDGAGGEDFLAHGGVHIVASLGAAGCAAWVVTAAAHGRGFKCFGVLVVAFVALGFAVEADKAHVEGFARVVDGAVWPEGARTVVGERVAHRVLGFAGVVADAAVRAAGGGAGCRPDDAGGYHSYFSAHF